MPPFNLDSEAAALLYLINLTAGLMDGDAHRIDLTARAGTRAVVTGPIGHPHPPGGRQLRHAAVGCRLSRTTPAWSSCPDPRSRSGSRYFQHGRVQLAPRPA